MRVEYVEGCGVGIVLNTGNVFAEITTSFVAAQALDCLCAYSRYLIVTILEFYLHS